MPSLDQVLYQSWLEIEDRVMLDPVEVRRRLDRRARMYERVPRPFCLALKASDGRLIQNVRLWPRDAACKGHEQEHSLTVTAAVIRALCRPVELCWGKRFRALARELGGSRQAPGKLEKRGVLRGRRIAGLGGHWGTLVPLVDSPVPATAPADRQQWADYGYPELLDPGKRGCGAPDPLLVPYWQGLSARLPEGFEQTLTRRPAVHIHRNGVRAVHWAWRCPECGENTETLLLPMGAPDFAALHGIALAGSEEAPEPRLCFACEKCHRVAGFSRTARSIAKTWSTLVAHVSSGLLFGKEVPWPASFGVLRKDRKAGRRRASPRQDEVERYLVETDLPLKEIARRMGCAYATVLSVMQNIRRKRGVKGGRAGLKRWHQRHGVVRGEELCAA